MESDSNATVHGVVVDLSPTKSSRNNPDIKYFSAKLSDGNKASRMISFKQELRSSLERSRKDRAPVREGKFDPALDIVASSNTKV